MNKVYLLLGSNLSDPLQQLATARNEIEKIGNLVAESAIYRTNPWGKSDQPDFYNQVLLIETSLNPADTLNGMLAIENSMGRIRSEKNAPRLIDIDILFYNSMIIQEKNLSIPHPRLAQRRFVLTPLNEIAPDLIHPVLGITVEKLLAKCTDPLEVKRY